MPRVEALVPLSLWERGRVRGCQERGTRNTHLDSSRPSPRRERGQDKTALCPASSRCAAEGSQPFPAGHIMPRRMIRFACTCSYVLEVPTELAGTGMQCPNCGHLVDIPPVSELAAIDEDGTYKMDDVQVEEERYRVAEQIAAFTQERVDQFGRKKTSGRRRTTSAGWTSPRKSTSPTRSRRSRSAFAPKYDPVTGELIRPLDVSEHKPPVNPHVIPAVDVQMSRIKSVLPPFQTHQIIPSLFKFTNVVVMLVILVGHIFQQFVFFVALAGIWLLVPAAFILTMLFFSHYAVIIDDIGREDARRASRPLRDLSWHDDLWGPFVQFFALLLCYGLGFGILWMPLIPGLAWLATVLIAGTLLFPAVFLDADHQRLDREPHAGPADVRDVVDGRFVRDRVHARPLAALVYVAGIAGTMVWLASMFVSPDMLQPRNTIEGFFSSPPPWLVYPLLALGILLMHGFCWIWPAVPVHNASFGWAFQRHDGPGAGDRTGGAGSPSCRRSTRQKPGEAHEGRARSAGAAGATGAATRAAGAAVAAAIALPPTEALSS